MTRSGGTVAPGVSKPIGLGLMVDTRKLDRSGACWMLTVRSGVLGSEMSFMAGCDGMLFGIGGVGIFHESVFSARGLRRENIDRARDFVRRKKSDREPGWTNEGIGAEMFNLG